MNIAIKDKYVNIIIVLIIALVSGVIAKKVHSNYLWRKNELERRRKEMEQKKIWSTKIINIEKGIKLLRAKPLEGDIFYFKKLIEDAAKKSEVTIILFKPMMKGETDDYKEAEVTLRVYGSYKNLTTFIKTLEDLGVIEVVNLRKDRGDNYSLIIIGLLRK